MLKKLLFGFLILLLGIMTFAQLSLLQAKAETPLSYPITYFETTPTPTISPEPENNTNNNTNDNNSDNQNTNTVEVTVNNTNSSEQKSPPAHSGLSSGSKTGGPTSYFCTDSKPDSAPVLVSATQTGNNQVTLFWNKANDPVTHYAIVYGTEPGKPKFGIANTGSNETSYTINHLIGGKTYYFRVYGIYGCMPGNFSNELSQTALGQNVENSEDTVLGDYDSHVQSESDEDTVDYPKVDLSEDDNSWAWLWHNRIFGSIGAFFSGIFNIFRGK